MAVVNVSGIYNQIKQQSGMKPFKLEGDYIEPEDLEKWYSRRLAVHRALSVIFNILPIILTGPIFHAVYYLVRLIGGNRLPVNWLLTVKSFRSARSILGDVKEIIDGANDPAEFSSDVSSVTQESTSEVSIETNMIVQKEITTYKSKKDKPEFLGMTNDIKKEIFKKLSTTELINSFIKPVYMEGRALAFEELFTRGDMVWRRYQRKYLENCLSKSPAQLTYIKKSCFKISLKQPNLNRELFLLLHAGLRLYSDKVDDKTQAIINLAKQKADWYSELYEQVVLNKPFKSIPLNKFYHKPDEKLMNKLMDCANGKEEISKVFNDDGSNVSGIVKSIGHIDVRDFTEKQVENTLLLLETAYECLGNRTTELMRVVTLLPIGKFESMQNRFMKLFNKMMFTKMYDLDSTSLKPEFTMYNTVIYIEAVFDNFMVGTKCNPDFIYKINSDLREQFFKRLKQKILKCDLQNSRSVHEMQLSLVLFGIFNYSSIDTLDDILKYINKGTKKSYNAAGKALSVLDVSELTPEKKEEVLEATLVYLDKSEGYCFWPNSPNKWCFLKEPLSEQSQQTIVGWVAKKCGQNNSWKYAVRLLQTVGLIPKFLEQYPQQTLEIVKRLSMSLCNFDLLDQIGFSILDDESRACFIARLYSAYERTGGATIDILRYLFKHEMANHERSALIQKITPTVSNFVRLIGIPTIAALFADMTEDEKQIILTNLEEINDDDQNRYVFSIDEKTARTELIPSIWYLLDKKQQDKMLELIRVDVEPNENSQNSLG